MCGLCAGGLFVIVSGGLAPGVASAAPGVASAASGVASAASGVASAASAVSVGGRALALAGSAQSAATKLIAQTRAAIPAAAPAVSVPDPAKVAASAPAPSAPGPNVVVPDRAVAVPARTARGGAPSTSSGSSGASNGASPRVPPDPGPAAAAPAPRAAGLASAGAAATRITGNAAPISSPSRPQIPAVPVLVSGTPSLASIPSAQGLAARITSSVQGLAALSGTMINVTSQALQLGDLVGQGPPLPGGAGPPAGAPPPLKLPSVLVLPGSGGTRPTGSTPLVPVLPDIFGTSTPGVSSRSTSGPGGPDALFSLGNGFGPALARPLRVAIPEPDPARAASTKAPAQGNRKLPPPGAPSSTLMVVPGASTAALASRASRPPWALSGASAEPVVAVDAPGPDLSSKPRAVSHTRARLRHDSSPGAGSVETQVPGVGSAPFSGAAPSGATAGAVGAGAAAGALLAVSFVWLLYGLLTGRLTLDLFPWQSALLASRLERPG